MARELAFKDLPFVPVKGQVIYVEQSYNKKLNKFIHKNYDWLKAKFRRQGLEFCFLPLLAEETIGYHAPYLNDKERNSRVNNVPTLNKYVVGSDIDTPYLVFGLDITIKDADGNTILQVLPIETKWYIGTKLTFSHLAKEVKRLSESQSRKYKEIKLIRKARQEARKRFEEAKLQHNEDHGFLFRSPDEPYQVNKEEEEQFSLRIESEHCSQEYEIKEEFFNYCDGPNPEEADENFDFESQLLIDEIKQRINALRDRGVNTMFLHDLIDEGEHLSRLKITRDFRLFLIDYDNLEIKMPILPKAVFVLFLRHPEGIRFKELSDYYSELLQIYLKMNPNGERMKQEKSIRDITDPCCNSINEKCARIREAFVSNFDERIAKNYYVTGKRGEAKRIILDESMVIWE